MPVIIHDFEIVLEEPETPAPSPSEPPRPAPPPSLRPADVRLIVQREARRAARVRAH